MIVQTASGPVRGARRDGVTVFAGIPYAEPPVGPLRFRAPRPVAPWSEARDALDFGNCAMQPDGAYTAGFPLRSEDSLVLHVWTPQPDGARRPVMVWLHGGGFEAGVGRDEHSDGTVLAREEDVVVVSLNHRLGVFGFLRLGALDEGAYPDADNVGMLDIVTALTWIRDNIRRFGGDEDNVTVFGMSGGGWKISVLLAMPAARGLFHKGIIQSGSELRATALGDAEDATRELLERLGVARDDLERIQDIPADRILDAAYPHNEGDIRGWFLPDGTWWWDLVFAPAVDGRTLPRNPFWPTAPPEAAGIPLLIGTTRDELAGDISASIPLRFFPEVPTRFEEIIEQAEALGLQRPIAESAIGLLRARRPSASAAEIFNDLLSGSLFYLNCIRQLETKLAQGDDPVYSYLYAWGSNDGRDLALHGADVAYVFGNLGHEPRDEDALLSAQMRAAWAAFARSGDPNHPGLPTWPRYDLGTRATMVFGSDCAVEDDAGGDLRRILETTTGGT